MMWSVGGKEVELCLLYDLILPNPMQTKDSNSCDNSSFILSEWREMDKIMYQK